MIDATHSSLLDVWVKRVLTATLLAVVMALIAAGVVLYGPGARAQSFSEQDRSLASKGVVQ